MSDEEQEKLCMTFAQIRQGLVKAQELVAALDAKTLGEDGETVKAAILERYSQQIAQLRYLETRIILCNKPSPKAKC